MSHHNIPIQKLRAILDYDPVDGRFTWRTATPDLFEDGRHSKDRRCRVWNTRFAGKSAFTCKVAGYPRARVLGVPIYAHRAAWAIVFGVWPGELDHINRDRSDYRIVNLRQATRSENCANRPPYDGTTSPYRGVHYRRSSGRYIAQLKVQGHNSHLGSFASAEAAARAYDRAAQKHFGDFANLNFPDERPAA